MLEGKVQYREYVEVEGSTKLRPGAEILAVVKQGSARRLGVNNIDQTLKYDAIEMLETHHARIRGRFQEYENSKNGKRGEIAEALFLELEIHTRLEEDVLYPAVEVRSRTTGHKLVKEARKEHEEARELIRTLQELGPKSKDFDPMMKKLREDVERHIAEEEDEILPLAERLLYEDVERIGKTMKELESQLIYAGREVAVTI